MEIRILRREDAKKYFQLRLESLQESPENFALSYEEAKQKSIETYEKQFENPKNSFTFGAFINQQLVGIVTLKRQKLLKLRHRAMILSMYTKREYRGQGIGKALLKKAIEKARELGGIEQIHLTVVTTNEAAKKIYTSLGFKVIGKEEKALKYKGSYVDEENMVLFLNSSSP